MDKVLDIVLLITLGLCLIVFAGILRAAFIDTHLAIRGKRRNRRNS